ADAAAGGPELLPARRRPDPVGDLDHPLRQSVTPPRLLGRVSAINILSYGARPLGSAIGAIVGGVDAAATWHYLAWSLFGAPAPSSAAFMARKCASISRWQFSARRRW